MRNICNDLMFADNCQIANIVNIVIVSHHFINIRFIFLGLPFCVFIAFSRHPTQQPYTGRVDLQAIIFSFIQWYSLFFLNKNKKIGVIDSVHQLGCVYSLAGNVSLDPDDWNHPAVVSEIKAFVDKHKRIH